MLLVAFMLAGVGIGFAETAESTVVAHLLPEHLRGNGFGVLGLVPVLRHPGVLHALSPVYGVRYFVHNGWHGFPILGVVVLCLPGGEALYADMGHFGRSPIGRSPRK